MRKEVELIIPIAVVLGNAKSQDALAGRLGGHIKVKRMCRACDCNYNQSADPYHQCQFYSQDTIENIQLPLRHKKKITQSDLEPLRELSRHRIPDNALHNITKITRLTALTYGEWPEVEAELAPIYLDKLEIVRELVKQERKEWEKEHRKIFHKSLFTREEINPDGNSILAGLSRHDQDVLKILIRRCWITPIYGAYPKCETDVVIGWEQLPKEELANRIHCHLASILDGLVQEGRDASQISASDLIKKLPHGYKAQIDHLIEHGYLLPKIHPERRTADGCPEVVLWTRSEPGETASFISTVIDTATPEMGSNANSIAQSALPAQFRITIDNLVKQGWLTPIYRDPETTIGWTEARQTPNSQPTKTVARFDVLQMLAHGPFHLVLLGLIKRCMCVFLGDLTPKSKEALDDSLDDCMRPAWTQRAKDRLPRLNFFRGMTNLTNLTGKEWVGVAFACLMCLNTAQGWNTFSKILTQRGSRMPPKKRKRANTFNNPTSTSQKSRKISKTGKPARVLQQEMAPAPESDAEGETDDESESDDDDEYDHTEPILEDEEAIVKVVNVIEMLLCYEAWISRGPFWSASEPELSQGEWSYQRSIRTMLHIVKDVMPRNTSVRYRLQKFHEQIHLPRDIRLYGHLANINEGIGEANLIHFSSDPARTAQKLGNNQFLRQICRATYDRDVVYRAASRCSISIARDRRNRRDNETRALEHEEYRKEQAKYYNKDGNAKVQFPIFQMELELMNGGSSYSARVFNCTVDKQNVLAELPFHISDWIANHYAQLLGPANSKIQVTAYSEMIQEGFMYRAHPNYRSTSPRFCWSAIQVPHQSMTNLPPSHRPSVNKQRQDNMVKRILSQRIRTVPTAEHGSARESYKTIVLDVEPQQEGSEQDQQPPSPKQKRLKSMFTQQRINSIRKEHLKECFGQKEIKSFLPVCPIPDKNEKGTYHTVGKLVAFTKLTKTSAGGKLTDAASNDIVVFYHGAWRGPKQRDADSAITQTYVLDYSKARPSQPNQYPNLRNSSNPLDDADGASFYSSTSPAAIKYPVFVVEDSPGTHQTALPHPEV